MFEFMYVSVEPCMECTLFVIGSRTLACLTTQGDCTYRYFVGTSTSDQQPPIVFEGESKDIVYVSK